MNSRSNTGLALESAIRARAYELYEKRGRQDGLAQDDWFQAEAEVAFHVVRVRLSGSAASADRAHSKF